jgi:tetratricopeptide (TPR) repeat protein
MISRKKRFVAMLLAFLAGVALVTSACSPEKRKARYLARGQEAMQKGKYSEASILFRQALQIDPRFAEADYQLGMADLKLHQWKAASDALTRAADLAPGRIDVHLALADLLVAVQRFDESEKEARLVLQKDPNNAHAYQVLGEALWARRQTGPAVEAFTKLTELRPREGEPYTDLAIAQLSAKNLPEAEKNFKKAVEVDPHYVVGVLNLAKYWESRNQPGEAEQVLSKGVQVNPEGIPLYLAWARLLADERKPEAVEAVLDKLRSRLPQSLAAAQAMGDFYASQRDSDRALAEYRRALSIAPRDLELKKKLADFYLNAGKVQPASDLVKEVLQQAPGDPEARLEQARILIAQGKAQDAILLAQQTVRDIPESAQAHYVLAMAYGGTGSLGQANAELQEARKHAPNSPPILEALARLSLRLSDLASAQDYAQQLVQIDPNDAQAHALLGAVLIRQRQFAPARAEFLTAQKLTQADPVISVDVGETFAGEQKWPEAEKAFEDALKLNPRYTPALGQLAGLWVSRNQPAKALARVQDYIARYPDDARGHYLLGELELHAKRYDEAESALTRATELDPGMAAAYVQLGSLQRQRGNLDAALARYQKALSLQPKSTALTIMVGDLYQAKGDLATAGQYYQTALTMDSGSGVAANDLAWVDAVQNKDLDNALMLAQKAKQLLPDADAVSDTLAWVYYKKGIYGAAIPLLQECVGKSPAHTVYHYHLGMALLANGEKAQGREQLQAALKSGLSGDDAQQAQKALAQAN